MYIQFIKESFFPVSALLCGIYSFRYFTGLWKAAWLQVFVYFVAIILAYWITPGTQTNPNQWLYNTQMPIETILLSSAAFQYSPESRWRKVIIALLALFLIAFSVNIFLGGFGLFASYAYIIGAIMISGLFGYIIYTEIYESNTIWHKSALFWMSLGLVIYYTCIIPYISVMHILNLDFPESSKALYRVIIDTLANVRYALLAIAFLLLRSKKTSIL